MNVAKPNSSYKHQVSNAGFTLIELMVTIAVLAIIVSIAAPNINDQLANQRVKSTISTLNNALKEAKVESLLRRQTMTLSYNNNGAALGSITITDPSSNVVASYQYDTGSTINSAQSQVNFQSNKTADVRTYTVCDGNLAATPRQTQVSAIATISSQLGGTCP